MVEPGFNQAWFSLSSPNLLVVLGKATWYTFRSSRLVALQPARGPDSPAVSLPFGPVHGGSYFSPLMKRCVLESE